MDRFEIINGTLERYSGDNTDIVIPEGVIIIDEVTWDCPSLRSVTLPHSLKIIDSFAFEDCDSLIKIDVPEGATSIGSRAFVGCTSLKEVNLPRTMSQIAPEAFYGCSSLKSIEIPQSVAIFGEKVFRDCIDLHKITVSENNELYDSRENCNAVIRTQTNQLLRGCYTTRIPDSVQSIGFGAFYECRTLSRIRLPQNLLSIGKEAFGVCQKLKDIFIPQNVRSIGDRAFWGCTELDTVICYDSVRELGNDVFYWCFGLRKLHVIRKTGNEKIVNELYKQARLTPQKVIENAVEDDDIDFVSQYAEDYISEANIDRLITMSARNQSTEVSAFLLRYKMELNNESEDYL